MGSTPRLLLEALPEQLLTTSAERMRHLRPSRRDAPQMLPADV